MSPSPTLARASLVWPSAISATPIVNRMLLKKVKTFARAIAQYERLDRVFAVGVPRRRRSASASVRPLGGVVAAEVKARSLRQGATSSAEAPPSRAARQAAAAGRSRGRWGPVTCLGRRLGVVVSHGVDGGDGVVLVDLDLDLGAVGLADVRLIGGAGVDVGLHALDRAGHLGQRSGAHLGLHGAGEGRLGLAVDGVPRVRRGR